MGDHSESIQIDYDPSRITYSELIDMFWQIHDPTRRSWSRQYMYAVFTHSESQARIAQQTLAREEKRRNAKIHTTVAPLSAFYAAEDYHQKYELRRDRQLMQVLTQIYPNETDFVGSTIAARLNGVLGGYGQMSDVKAALDRMGLRSEDQDRLFQVLKNR